MKDKGEQDFKKVEKDGKVAVLYSPEYGAGWSSWNDSEYAEALCMDADIVQCVLDGNKAKAGKVALSKFPDIYDGGCEDLKVEWVEKGKSFEIREYDGYETVHVIGNSTYMIA